MKPRRGHDIAKTARDVSASLYSASYFAQYLAGVFGLFMRDSAAMLNAAGAVFPPLAYVFDGFKAGFNLLVEYYKRKKSKVQEDEESISMAATIVKMPESLSGSAIQSAANVTVLVLDVIVVTVLAGALLSNPMGWAIAAVAATVGWIADDVIPAWRSRNEAKSCQKKLSDLGIQLANASTTAEKQAINAKINQWQIATNYANKTYLTARNKVLWGLAAVVGMALFACGPFGLGVLGLVGSAIFVGLAIKSIIEFIHDKRVSKNNQGLDEFVTTTAAIYPSVDLVANSPRPENQLANTQKNSSADVKAKLLVSAKITTESRDTAIPPAREKVLESKASVTKVGQFAIENDSREMSGAQVIKTPTSPSNRQR